MPMLCQHRPSAWSEVPKLDARTLIVDGRNQQPVVGPTVRSQFGLGGGVHSDLTQDFTGMSIPDPRRAMIEGCDQAVLVLRKYDRKSFVFGAIPLQIEGSIARLCPSTQLSEILARRVVKLVFRYQGRAASRVRDASSGSAKGFRPSRIAVTQASYRCAGQCDGDAKGTRPNICLSVDFGCDVSSKALQAKSSD